MGERAASLEATDREKGNEAPHASTRGASRQLEGDIAALREELGALVAELDRRRHDLVDVKLQLKRHAGGVALFGLALVATASGFVWLGMWRAQRRERVLSRVGRLREAVARMVDRPERVAAEPSVPAKILTAAATAAVATLVKKGLEQVARLFLEQPGTRQMPSGNGRWPALPPHGPSSAGDALGTPAPAAAAALPGREATV